MLRIIRKPKSRVRKRRLTEGEIRSITKAASQIIAVTVAEESSAVEKLLRKFQVRLSKKPKSQELISAIMDKLAEQDAKFILAFESIVVKVLPELDGQDGYDNFGQTPYQFGSGARITTGSSGSNLLDGAKTIGSSTASGAATGGIAGGILGAIGGIFGFASSAKEQKTQKEIASQRTFASMLNYKSMRDSLKGEGARNMVKIVVAIIVAAALVIGLVLYSKNKKAKKWDDQVEAA